MSEAIYREQTSMGNFRFVRTEARTFFVSFLEKKEVATKGDVSLNIQKMYSPYKLHI